jgi:NAD-dependent deacetylase
MARPAIDAARELLSQSRRITVLTGAGMSAESGVPTFRQAQSGLWARFDPAQLASEAGFRADPALVWRWYAWRRDAVARAKPHAGHLALAAAQDRFEQFVLVTQNVDGLHRRAGSRQVIELHGNIAQTICLEKCGYLENDPARGPAGEPPRCPQCGSWLRPGVVWFGEALDEERLAASQAAARDCEIMLVVGTSGLVYPAAGLPAIARASGAAILMINTDESQLDGLARLVIRESAARALPALLAV